MTVTVHIDNMPYAVEFSGAIEIARMADGETVAFRRVSEDAAIQISLDEAELARQREFMAEMHARSADLRHLWRDLIFKPSQSSCGGSSVRAGYD